jgi:hypothetical protein
MERKKIIFYLIGAISLVFLMVWISQGAVVFGQSFMDYFLPSGQDTSIPMQVQPRDESENVLPTALPLMDSSAEDHSHQEVVELIEGFNQIGQERYLQPGWLHIVQYEEAFVTAAESFSDGTPIPTEERIDQWYLLAENGEVLKSVTINDTGDPKTTQIVVYQDKKFTNLTFPNLASSEPEDSFLTNLDHGLAARMADHPEMEILKAQAEVDGHVVVTTSTYFDAPVTYASQITASGYAYVYQFDPLTGVVMSFEDYYLDQNGNRILRVRLETLDIENLASPPEDILQYFN